MEETPLINTFPLQIDDGNISHLSNAAKWAKFLAIIGFIFCALIAIFALFASQYLSAYFDEMDIDSTQDLQTVSSTAIKVVYIFIAFLYFFPSLYLFSFASRMQKALRLNDQVNLNLSFKNLKSCFKYMGILLIIIICIYTLTITFALLFNLSVNG